MERGFCSRFVARYPVRSIAQSLFAIALGLSLTVSRLDGETTSPDTFLAQYRRVLKEHEATYHNVQIEGRFRFTRHLQGSPSKREASKVAEKPLSERQWIEFAYRISDGDHKLALSVRNGAHYSEQVAVTAGGVFFSVRRSSPGGPYSLTESTETNKLPRELRTSPERVKEAPYCPWGYSEFPFYVNSPDFKILEVSRADNSAKGRVKLTFSYRPTDRKKPRMKGWVNLDPGANWVLTDFEIESITHPSEKAEIATQRSGAILYSQAEGLAVPVEVKYRNVLRAAIGSEVEEGEYQVDRFSVGPTPAKEFTLAAFGLGDFEGPSRRTGNRFAYYAVAVAVAAGFVSLVLSRLGRASKSKRSEAIPYDGSG